MEKASKKKQVLSRDRALIELPFNRTDHISHQPAGQLTNDHPTQIAILSYLQHAASDFLFQEESVVI